MLQTCKLQNWYSSDPVKLYQSIYQNNNISNMAVRERMPVMQISNSQEK